MAREILEQIILRQLGNIDEVVSSEEYKKCLREFVALEKEFLKELNDELIKTYEELEILDSQILAEETLKHYKEGYKMGMLTAIGVLT